MNAHALPWPSLAALWAANATPLFGVLFLGWRVPDVMLIYWAETILIGVFTMLRMRMAKKPPKDPNENANETIRGFAMFFGFFAFCHGAFVIGVFVLPAASSPGEIGDGGTQLVHGGIVVALLALVGSHWVSHATNYIGRGEYKRVSVDDLFLQPFPRVMVMHLVIIVGAWLTAQTGQPIALVAVLVLLKASIDTAAHCREHAKLYAPSHKAARAKPAGGSRP